MPPTTTTKINNTGHTAPSAFQRCGHGIGGTLPAAVVGCVAYAWRLLESLGLAAPPPGFVLAGGGH